MNFLKYWLVGFQRYMNFDDRATRTEYWVFSAVHFTLISFLLFLGSSTSPVFTVLCVLYFLAGAFPYLAVSVRRLHDSGKSGWWMFIYFVPLFGFFMLLAVMLDKGSWGKNRFGQPRNWATNLPQETGTICPNCGHRAPSNEALDREGVWTFCRSCGFSMFAR